MAAILSRPQCVYIEMGPVVFMDIIQCEHLITPEACLSPKYKFLYYSDGIIILYQVTQSLSM